MANTYSYTFSQTGFIAHQASDYDAVLATQDWTSEAGSAAKVYQSLCKERQPMTRPL